MGRSAVSPRTGRRPISEKGDVYRRPDTLIDASRMVVVFGNLCLCGTSGRPSPYMSVTELVDLVLDATADQVVLEQA
jgi:hypothetical protein